MRWARGVSRWALVAAGGLGLGEATVGIAATPPIVPAMAALAEDSAAGLARLAEIKVELAWLADPAAFSCRLAVRANNGTLEIGGLVHGEELHQRVLRLASGQSALPLNDKLTVQPGPPPRSTVSDSDPQLCHNAAVAMSKLTAAQAAGFEISADANGQIVVAGHTGSCEEKLKISRRLSQLPGCTSVVNNLTVAKAFRDGRVHTVVSADGQLTVPGEPSELVPSIAPPPPPTPIVSPEIVTPGVTPATTFMPVRPARTSAYTSHEQNFAPPTGQYGGATAMSATPPRYDPPTDQPQVISQQPVIYQPPAPTPVVIARGSTYGGSFNLVPSPKKPASAPPAALAKIAPVQRVALRPAPVPPVAVSPQQVSELIKQRIETVFRGSVRDVNVRATSDKQLRITLHVVRPSEGQAIGKRIMDLPELAPYQVDLQVPLQ